MVSKDTLAFVVGLVFGMLVLMFNYTTFADIDVALATLTLGGTGIHHGLAVVLVPIGFVLAWWKKQYRFLGLFLVGWGVAWFLDDFRDMISGEMFGL